jgi:hypothetical protein
MKPTRLSWSELMAKMGKTRALIKFCFLNLLENGYLEDRGDGRITLNWILEKKVVLMGNG